MTRNSLLVVPPATQILGAVSSDGSPATTIQWQISSVPIFIFNKADGSSMKHVHAQFTGSIPALYPYGDVDLLIALGYAPTFLGQNQMSGGNPEMFTFLYVFDSNRCTFDHLVFDSATQDNAHIYGNAIRVKGNGVLTGPISGLSELATGHVISNIAVYDCLGAMTIAGQDNMLIENVTADRRGSVSGLAPGHMLYTTSTNQFDPSGSLVTTLLSTNLTLEGISEGPNTYSNVVAGGTLAIKFLNGGTINNVTSYHPEGLIETIYAAENIAFSNMTWKSTYTLCHHVPQNCTAPVIYSTPSDAPYPPISNLSFQNIKLTSTERPITVLLMGDGLKIQGMTIETPPTYLPNQTVANAVLSIKSTNSAEIKDYYYTPLITSYAESRKYNNPLVGWNPALNVSAQMTVNWPKSIAVPAAGAWIITPNFQNHNSSDNNKATVKVAVY